MLSLFASSPSLLVGTPKVGGARMAALQMATIGESLATTNGPEIFWGPEGPLQNPMKEESDFKEWDTFSMFLDACKEHGVDLNAPGITVLAPANVAVAEYTATYGPLTKAICEYHVIQGESRPTPRARLARRSRAAPSPTAACSARTSLTTFVGVKASPPAELLGQHQVRQRRLPRHQRGHLPGLVGVGWRLRLGGPAPAANSALNAELARNHSTFVVPCS